MTTTETQEMPSDAVLLVEIEGADAPLSPIGLGYTSRFTYQFTWVGIVTLILLRRREIEVEVTLIALGSRNRAGFGGIADEQPSL